MNEETKVKWEVTSNSIGGKTMYAVYRLIDEDEINHSGNREYATGYLENKRVCEYVAASLNLEHPDTAALSIEEREAVTNFILDYLVKEQREFKEKELRKE
ncbi:hypothetical protein LQZ18_08405 [Lachnospiraceae bacterium ZAX-1]